MWLGGVRRPGGGAAQRADFTSRRGLLKHGMSDGLTPGRVQKGEFVSRQCNTEMGPRKWRESRLPACVRSSGERPRAPRPPPAPSAACRGFCPAREEPHPGVGSAPSIGSAPRYRLRPSAGRKGGARGPSDGGAAPQAPRRRCPQPPEPPHPPPGATGEVCGEPRVQCRDVVAVRARACVVVIDHKTAGRRSR